MRPVGDDGATIACPVCATRFQRSGRRRFCSAACRSAAWRRRQETRPALAVPTASRDATVYECGSCGQRLLGTQRCQDCGIFAAKVGPGGHCPHCDEPVAFADLVEAGPR